MPFETVEAKCTGGRAELDFIWPCFVGPSATLDGASEVVNELRLDIRFRIGPIREGEPQIRIRIEPSCIGDWKLKERQHGNQSPLSQGGAAIQRGRSSPPSRCALWQGAA
jgi:hypothetical protein